ncbi:hypothetical protein CCC_04069 [Paramagnetospirillum magnetotacticum MS-1]|uniref:Phage terminase small subunit P27 family n=1 Tax=Paramagnetospirillum magnetotacticum MS-1 TaxID=272627 RepID=A0A0C2YWP9_PARME|nr:hypothetical protein CCC_04069 [Paramagnetospirillum magnetotacticum MS-1]
MTAPPPELQGVALAEWQRLAPLLRERGMLSPLDRNHLQLYCEQWSVYRQAVAAMAETGIAIPTAAGGSKTSPFGLVIESTSRSLRGLAGELGLHFLSRSRLGIKESEATTKSEWDEFL